MAKANLDNSNDNPDIWDPSSPQELANAAVDWDQLRKDRTFFYDPKRDDETESKWRLLRKPKIPEPVAEDVVYAPKQLRLVERFLDSGLQVIVKMASIELSPEKPEFPVGGWHVRLTISTMFCYIVLSTKQIECQMNEHICATALYYVDCENVTASQLSFRMQTRSGIDQEEKRFMVGQNSYKWLEQIYGTTLGSGDSPALQNYGSIETKEGRLLAFPNVL
jgi:hypothetical protein